MLQRSLKNSLIFIIFFLGFFILAAVSKKIVLCGNRTRTVRVTDEYSTTGPTIAIYCKTV